MAIAHEERYINHIDALWAKTAPHKALLCHMIDVGNCCKAYLGSKALSAVSKFLADQWNCDTEEAISFTAYLSAMHDIGKATPQFQMQNAEELSQLKATEVREILPDKLLNPVRHEFMSRLITNRIWKARGENRRLYDAYSCILSLHHQKIDKSERNRPVVHEGWQIIQDEIERLIGYLFKCSGTLPKPKNMDAVCILLTGILILCDWVASSGPFDELPEMTDSYVEDSLKIAKQAIKRCGLIEDHRIPEFKSFQSMWPMIAVPRDIQIKTEMLDPSALLTIIEAPMGEGKTEAALYCAGRAAHQTGKRGIYVALPTQATSNQMYGRVSAMLESLKGGNTRLLHGTAFLMKSKQDGIRSDDAFDAEKWLGTARMGLLDENGVGTVDQAMGAVLLARFSVLRLLGLANKSLVIDELHAYDAYMSEIIESLLRWCRALEIPVILLSATLQNSQRKRYLSCYINDENLPELNESYPLITQVGKDMQVFQVEAAATLKTGYHFVSEAFGQDEKMIAHFAFEKVNNGGCYCIISNTVRRAQKIYEELMQIKDPDLEIMLFHARFLMGRREEIEENCLQKFGKGADDKRPKRAILVATQVVEQSLDIDFDGMISELAPIDLLLQRAGRVHRHRNRIRPVGLEKPVIHVVVPDEDAGRDLEKRYGASGFVYDPFLLSNTEKLIRSERTICVPDEVRSVIAEAYEEVNEQNMKAWTKRCFSEQLLSANADGVSFPEPKTDFFFPTQSHPEFANLEVDDGFDPASRAATRLGEPTFRIAFVDSELLEKAKKGYLSKELQKQVLLNSVSLRLTPDIEIGLSGSDDIYQIQGGALWGCYLVEHRSKVNIGNKSLINSRSVGLYWEEQ